jgi:hypothetical protein
MSRVRAVLFVGPVVDGEQAETCVSLTGNTASMVKTIKCRSKVLPSVPFDHLFAGPTAGPDLAALVGAQMAAHATKGYHSTAMVYGGGPSTGRSLVLWGELGLVAAVTQALLQLVGTEVCLLACLLALLLDCLLDCLLACLLANERGDSYVRSCGAGRMDAVARCH